MESLKTAYQYILPQHLLTRFVGKLAASKKSFIKQNFIDWFIGRFNVDMTEALDEDPKSYACFNDFFTRPLKDGARPIDDSPTSIVSPVDGAVSQAGPIEDGYIFQAKGHRYTLHELLGGEQEWVDAYQDGEFATLYLSPKDYHRIHMPVAGKLMAMTYVPGRLFSVNPITARTIPRLFARNERVIAHYQTELGPMAMVLVGATIVGSIETTWSGIVTPPTGPAVKTWRYDNNESSIDFERGQEMGRFRLGSTVILIFGKDVMTWDESLKPEASIRMGRPIASVQSQN